MKALFKLIFTLVLMSVIISIAASLVHDVIPFMVFVGIIYLVFKFRIKIKNFLGIGNSDSIR